MQRRVNVPLLVRSAAIVGVLAVVVYFVHSYQVRRNAHYLLQRADEALAKEELDTALTYYGQYLSLVPGDPEATEKFALTLDQVAADLNERIRVVIRLEEVLRRDADKHHVRHRLVQNLMALTRFKEAIPHLQALRGQWKDEAQICEWLGLCQQGLGDLDAAAASYDQAIAAAPSRVESYVLLAELQQGRVGFDQEAEHTVQRLIDANPKAYRAFLARAEFERRRGRAAAAEKYLHEAAALAPDEPAVLVAAARWAESAGQLEEARRLVERGLQKHPGHADLHAALADLDIRAGKRPDAIRAVVAGLEQAPHSADLQVLLVDLLIDEKKTDEAAARLAQFREVPPPLASYLRARLAIEHGRWAEAVGLLEKARADLGSASRWSSRVSALLGACHEQLGDTEQRLAAFRQAAAIEPGWAGARYGLGLAALAAGHVEEAIQELDALSQRKDAPPGVWAALARAHLASQLRKPADRRDWSTVEGLLDKVDKASGVSEATVVRAELLAAQNRLQDARKLLETRRSQDKQLVLWLALADVAARQADYDGALAILADAEAAFGDSAALRLARGGVYGLRGNADDRHSLRALAEKLDRFAPHERLRLLRAFGNGWQRLGEPDRAEQLWRQIAAEHAADLPSRLLLLEAALARRDSTRAGQLIAELRRLEGEQGIWWRYGTAAVQVAEAAGAADKLEAARRLLGDATIRQRGGAPVALLEARIDEQLGQHERALQHYVRAIEQGERNPRLLRLVLALLVERRAYLQAEQVVAKLEEHGPLPSDLARTAAEVALANKNEQRVRQFLAQAAPAQPRDYRDLLWLAKMHQGLGESAQAEALLRRAVQAAEHVPETWIALAQHLIRTDQRPAALALASTINEKVPARRLAYALARCYEAMGEETLAIEWYKKALAQTPADLAVLAAAADFYRRADRLVDAEPLLRRLLDPALGASAEVVAAARRQLALAAAARGADTEALALLEGNEKALGPASADQRVRWRIEAGHPAKRAPALERLKESFRREPAQPEEELLLVRAYASDDPATARALLAQLMGSHETPQLLAEHARLLIRLEDFREAEVHFAKLERLEPNARRTLELKQLLMKSR